MCLEIGTQARSSLPDREKSYLSRKEPRKSSVRGKMVWSSANFSIQTKPYITADNAATNDSLRYLFVRSARALHYRDRQPGLWQGSVWFCNEVLSSGQVTVSAEINCDVAHILKRTTTSWRDPKQYVPTTKLDPLDCISGFRRRLAPQCHHVRLRIVDFHVPI